MNPQQPSSRITLPNDATVTRWKNLLELALLLISFPWILYRLLTHPRDLLKNREGA